MTGRDGNAAPEPRLQDLAGRYVIGRELGRGTMGVVYEAEDAVLHRTVAIKTIELAFAVTPRERAAFEERFFTEARMGARLSHPAIVVCHDVGKDPETGRLFIVFERLRGQTLSERVARGGALPWEEAVTLVAAIARAIHHAHEHGIVHRDLKPANVMQLDTGAVKLLDFGIARMESVRVRLTASGQAFGSPLYMSPEQALGQPSDARSDIFSLGSILGTLLLGKPWFDAPSIPQILARVIRDEPPPVGNVAAGAPAHLDLVVARALAKKAEGRYATAAALAGDLEDVLAGRRPRHASAKPEPNREGTIAEAVDPEAILAELTRPGPAHTTGGRTATVDVLSPMFEELLEPTERPADTVRTPRRLASRLLAAACLVGLGAAAAYMALRAPRAAVPAATLAVTPAPETGTPLPEPQTTAAAAPPLIPAPSEAPPAIATTAAVTPASTPAAAPRSGMRIDVEHAIKNGSLNVWLDGVLVFETRLQAAVTKRILAMKLREGRAQKAVEVLPGRHEIRVEVGWDGNNRRAETRLVDVPPNTTGFLKIRISRGSNDISIDWIWQ